MGSRSARPPGVRHLGPHSPEVACPELHHYNWHRPNGGLHGRPPISRLVSADNLVSLHSSPIWKDRPTYRTLAWVVPGKEQSHMRKEAGHGEGYYDLRGAR